MSTVHHNSVTDQQAVATAPTAPLHYRENVWLQIWIMIVVSFCDFRCFCLNVLFTYSASISHSAPAKSSVLIIKFCVIFSRFISHRRRVQSFSFPHLPCWSITAALHFCFCDIYSCFISFSNDLCVRLRLQQDYDSLVLSSSDFRGTVMVWKTCRHL